MVCEGVQDILATSSRTSNTGTTSGSSELLLRNTCVWREMASCLSLAPPLLELPQTLSAAPVSGDTCVGLAVCCSLVESGRPFKYLVPSVDWILHNLPALDGDVHTSNLFFSLFYSLLKTVHLCCSSQCKDSLLHQTELLHALSAWARAEPKIHINQWRAVLLLALTGSTQTPPDSLIPPDLVRTPPDLSPDLVRTSPDLTPVTVSVSNRLDLALIAVQLTCLPTSPSIGEKLIESLLNWLGHADSNSIRETILGYFAALKSCEQYQKSFIWSTLAHLI